MSTILYWYPSNNIQKLNYFRLFVKLFIKPSMNSITLFRIMGLRAWNPNSKYIYGHIWLYIYPICVNKPIGKSYTLIQLCKVKFCTQLYSTSLVINLTHPVSTIFLHYFDIQIRIMLEIQIFLQKVLQTVDVLSDYW